MTDYEALFKRLAQEVIKTEGKLSGDAKTFVADFLVKLRAEGYQLDGNAETVLSDYLAGIDGAVQLAVSKAVAVGQDLPLTAASLQSAEVLAATEAAFVAKWPDGLTLSKRLWHWKDETRSDVSDVLKRGIKQGKAVNAVIYDMQRTIERSGGNFAIVSRHQVGWVDRLAEAGKLLIDEPDSRKYWQQVVAETEGYINGLVEASTRNDAVQLLEKIKAATEKGRYSAIDRAVGWKVYGKQLYNLKRIARSEMADAGHKAVIDTSIDDKDVIGYHWRLSASHKVPDICDYFASIEMGLGKGVYTKESVPRGKAHPLCMCLIVPRVTPIRQAGDKNYAEFIQNAKPELQGKLLPKWASEAINDGVPVANLVRRDGLGLVTKAAAVNEINLNLARKSILALTEKAKGAGSLVDLWANPRAYDKHLSKRVALGHAADEADYFRRTLLSIRNAEGANVSGTSAHPEIELVNGTWSVIINKQGQIKTSYDFNEGMESFTEQQLRKGRRVYGYSIREIGKQP